jgi:Flp pilus assembly protein TadD
MSPAAESTPAPRGHALLALALLAAAVLAAYANSLGGPFVFDDVEAIVENPTIRDLAAPWAVLSPPFAEGQTVGGRPLVNVTLAVNYALGELNPAGYHALNLGIHLAATLVLFGLVRRTVIAMRSRPGTVAGGAPTPGSIPRGEGTPPTLSPVAPIPDRALDWISPVPFAAAVALLWGLHPLQTEAVTYVIQRAESLMGLCYLLTLYCFVRAQASPARAGWLAASAGCCLAGMAVKEVMVSAPLMVLLFDRAFVSGTLTAAWRRARGSYVTLAATWLLLAALVLSTKDRGGSMGLGLNVTLGSYLLTQGPAILHYLRLVVWPHPLIFDYGAIFEPSLRGALPAVLVVAALALGSLWLLWKKPVAGFLASWFFAVLAPTSLVPANRQTISEHRVYLALAPLLILGAWAAARSLRRLPAPSQHRAFRAAAGGVVLLALGAGVLTAQRNRVYQSNLTLWTDTVAHRPENPHAHSNLGIAFADAGRTTEARDQFAQAVRLEPRMASFRNNLGSALMALGQPEPAAEQYRRAVELLPSFAGAWANLGRALDENRRFPEAVAAFDEALRQHPGDWEVRLARTVSLLQAGQLDPAATELNTLVRERPDHVGARSNLALALSQLNRLAEAAVQYGELVRLQPNDAQLHNSYGVALAQAGRLPEARTQFAEAVRLDPNATGARNNLNRVETMLRP